jgi:hypothetical protein
VRGFERIADRFQRLDGRMHPQFMCMVGIQLTTMLTIMGALAAAFARTR